MKSSYSVYPADAKGLCLRGFARITCRSIDKAQRAALDLEWKLRKFGFKYHHIAIKEA